MLSIRPEQLLTMQQPRIDAYLAKVLPQLEERFPDAYEQHGGDEEVKKLVTNTLAITEQNGLETEGEVTALSSLLLVFGEDLLEREPNAWMKKILASGSIANEDKVPMIIERMVAGEGG